MWGEDVRIRPLTSLSHPGSQPTDKKSCQAGGGYLERYRPALKFMTMTMFSAATPIKDHAALAPPTDQAEASKIIESNASKVRPTRSPRVWLMSEICEREAAPSPRVVVEVDYVSDAVMGLIMTTDLLALVPAAQRACDSLSTGMSDSSGEDDSLRNSAPRIPTVEGYDGDLTMFSSAKYYMDSYARDSILLGQRRIFRYLRIATASWISRAAIYQSAAVRAGRFALERYPGRVTRHVPPDHLLQRPSPFVVDERCTQRSRPAPGAAIR